MFLLSTTLARSKAVMGNKPARIVVPPLSPEALRWAQALSCGRYIEDVGDTLELSVRIPTYSSDLADWIEDHTRACPVAASPSEVLHDGGSAIALVGSVAQIQECYAAIAGRLRAGDTLIIVSEDSWRRSPGPSPAYIRDARVMVQGLPLSPLVQLVLTCGYAFVEKANPDCAGRYVPASVRWILQKDGEQVRLVHFLRLVATPKGFKRIEFAADVGARAAGVEVLDAVQGHYIKEVTSQCLRDGEYLWRSPEQAVKNFAAGYLVDPAYIKANITRWLEEPPVQRDFGLLLTDLRDATSLYSV